MLMFFICTVQNAYNLWSFQLQDIPSTRQGQSSMMQGNGMFEVDKIVIWYIKNGKFMFYDLWDLIWSGPASQNVSSNETCNVIASDHFEANPTELQNQKLGTEPDACGSKTQLKRKVLKFSGWYYFIYRIWLAFSVTFLYIRKGELIMFWYNT